MLLAESGYRTVVCAEVSKVITHTWSLAASGSPVLTDLTSLIPAMTASRRAWVGCSRGGNSRLYPGLVGLVSVHHGQSGLSREIGAYVVPPAAFLFHP